MPSPLGHILAGGAVYLAGTKKESGSRFLLIVALLGSVISDLDFLPGILIGNMRAFHHGISHSLVFAFLFGVVTMLVTRRLHPEVAARASLLAVLAYTSHVLLDFVSVNEGARGVRILWPISNAELGINVRALGHFQYTDIRNGIWSVVRWDNVLPLLRELLILGGLVIALLLKRGAVNRSVRRLIPMRFASLFPLFVWITWVGIITLYPYDFGTSLDRSFSQIALVRQFDDIFLNAVLFVPLGAWLHKQGRSRSLELKSILIFTCISGVLTSSLIECLQLFLPSRFPSVVDVIANTAGALIGVYVHRRWASAVDDVVTRLRNCASGVYTASLMGAVAASALLISAVLQSQTQLSNWDLSYPLLVGNERTGDRPWRGRVYEIEVTDAATPPELLQRFADGHSVVIPGARIAAFDLSGAAPYRDRTGNVPDLTWAGDSKAHSNSTLAAVTSKHSWLRTEGAATTLIRRLSDSNAFSLSIRCASNDLSQEGPARIVSNSIDAGYRNLTLGQGRSNLLFRVRTPHTGNNALNPEFGIPAVFSDTEPREILVTYDGVTARATVAKSGRVYGFELSPGSSLIAAMNASALLGELEAYKLAYIAGLFVLPGTLVYVLVRSWRTRLVWSGFWVFGFTLLFEATLVLVSGRPFDWASVATTGLVGVLVFLATLVIPAGLIESAAV
jgi:membrane-bound metal-dependent hydrolase YbcI (DUF457 family)/glycopeptide antibiotics resistance protein